RAAANERTQLSRGGVEAEGDVYRVMRVAYPAAFLVMILEGALRSVSTLPFVLSGLIVFALGKTLKWWAIVTLGPAWTFRVITVPGSTLVQEGPYRFLRHPNYIGVIGELAGIALATHALISGPLVTLGFGLLILKRIRVEERALRMSPKPPASSL